MAALNDSESEPRVLTSLHRHDHHPGYTICGVRGSGDSDFKFSFSPPTSHSSSLEEKLSFLAEQRQRDLNRCEAFAREVEEAMEREMMRRATWGSAQGRSKSPSSEPCRRPPTPAQYHDTDQATVETSGYYPHHGFPSAPGKSKLHSAPDRLSPLSPPSPSHDAMLHARKTPRSPACGGNASDRGGRSFQQTGRCRAWSAADLQGLECSLACQPESESHHSNHGCESPAVTLPRSAPSKTTSSSRADVPHLPLSGRHRPHCSWGYNSGSRALEAPTAPCSPSWIADISYYTARKSYQESWGASNGSPPFPLILAAAAGHREGHHHHDGGSIECGLRGSSSGRWQVRSRRMSRRARKGTDVQPLPQAGLLPASQYSNGALSM